MTHRGNTVYDKITSRVREAENQHEKYSRSIYDIEKGIEKLVDEREQSYFRIAELHLPELTAETVKAQIHQLKDDVQRIFQKKQERRKTLDDLMRVAREEQELLERTLQAADGALGEKTEHREAARERIARVLCEDSTYVDLRSRAENATQTLAENKKQYESFKKHAEQKLEAFEEHPLFAYLIRIGYGTRQYKPGRIAQRLDAAIARMVRFEQQKPNYEFLAEAPEELRRQIDQRQQDVDKLVADMKAREDAVAQQHNLPTIVSEYDALVQKRKTTQAAIETKQKEYEKYAQDRNALDNTQDEYHKEALQRLKNYFKGQDIATLKKKARETHTKEDDDLINRIEAIDQEIREKKDRSKDVKKDQQAYEQKVEGLKHIQSSYSAKNYESSRCYFDHSLDISCILEDFLADRCTEHTILSSLDTHHHFEPHVTYHAPTVSSWGHHNHDSHHHHSSGIDLGGFFSSSHSHSDSGSSWSSSSSDSGWSSSSSYDSGGSCSTSDSF